MQRVEAARVVRHLLAGFPDAALDEAQVELYTDEVALLVDPGVAADAAVELVRTYPRFPAISEYRAAYHTVVRREERKREREERERLASQVNPQTREEVAAEIRRFSEALTLRVRGDVEAQVDLPVVGEGKCADCTREGELVQPGPGPLQLCRSCAGNRIRVAERLRRNPNYERGISESSFAPPPSQVEHEAEVAQEVEVDK